MNELQIITPQINVSAGVIEISNLEDIKQGLAIISERYKGVIVTDDDERYSTAKKQRAEIRKIISQVDSKRKEIKDFYTAPLKAFEAQVKDVIAIADEAAKELDSNIKAVEQMRRDKKLEEVKQLIAEHSEGYDIQMVDKWLNQTYKTATIIDDIKSQVHNAKQLEAELEEKRDMIRSACKMAKFDEAGWLAMFEAGADAHDVVNRISSEYDRQQKEALEQAEEAPQEPVQQVETEVVEEQGIAKTFAEAKAQAKTLTATFEITATFEQHRMLGAFCKANGITVIQVKV